MTPALFPLDRPSHCPLPEWGVIAIEGAEAADFIHRQLSQDFLLLPPDAARLALWCTPQGRSISSFYGFKPSAEQVFLLLPADNLDFVLKRLKMFVLRSKCSLRDASADWLIQGHMQPQPQPQPQAPDSDYSAAALPLQADGAGWRWQLPTVATAQGRFVRHISVQPASAAPAAPSDAGAQALWQWLQVMSGVAWVNAALREALVPQMLNYESLGGINFKKGCYPGQEVVARSQFRGQIKRRTFLFHSAAALQAAEEVHNAEGQPSGLVLMSAAAPTGGYHALASVFSQAAEAGGLQVRGHALALQALPYALLEDV